MNGTYPAMYVDKNGEINTVIHIDGRTLRLSLRGVEFWGYDFDGLEPSSDTDPLKLTTFTLQHGDLCSCTIECKLPIEILIENQTINADLGIHLELGDPAPNGSIDREDLRLTLSYNDNVIRSTGKSGWFEDELLDIQKAMPAGHFLKICFGCAFSDYSPYGHGLFGNMFCFRNNKEAYISIKTKDDLFAIWHTAIEEPVQETHLCSDFQIRDPGTGYRG